VLGPTRSCRAVPSGGCSSRCNGHPSLQQTALHPCAALQHTRCNGCGHRRIAAARTERCPPRARGTLGYSGTERVLEGCSRGTRGVLTAAGRARPGRRFPPHRTGAGVCVSVRWRACAYVCMRACVRACACVLFAVGAPKPPHAEPRRLPLQQLRAHEAAKTNGLIGRSGLKRLTCGNNGQRA
jgi:hypothetical protein